MKQSWQHLSGARNDPANMAIGRYNNTSNTSGNVPFEFDVYTKAEFQDDRFIFAEYVHGGESSLKFIRKKLTSSSKNSGGTSATNAIETHALNAIVAQPLPQSIETDSDAQVACRTQTRIFMKMRGWPIKYFKSLEELLRVFLDAVNGILSSSFRLNFYSNSGLSRSRKIIQKRHLT
jgi:hypothetical protein